MAVKLIENIRRLPGESRPSLMRGIDGHSYVVKFQGNPRGTQVLTNELLGSGLAERIGLSVAKAEVVELPAELCEAMRLQSPEETAWIHPGLHIGSRWLTSVEEARCHDWLPRRRPCLVRNLDEFIGIRAFDLWVGNSGARKTLYLKLPGEDTFRVVFINHSQCFSWTWNPPESLSREILSWADGIEKWLSWVARIEALFSGAVREQIDAVPQAWQISDFELKALQTRLSIRMGMLLSFTDEVVRAYR